MSDQSKPQCPKCKLNVLQSLSIRCMYCGAELPRQLQPSDELKKTILSRHQQTNLAYDLAMEEKAARDGKKKQLAGKVYSAQ